MRQDHLPAIVIAKIFFNRLLDIASQKNKMIAMPHTARFWKHLQSLSELVILEIWIIAAHFLRKLEKLYHALVSRPCASCGAGSAIKQRKALTLPEECIRTKEHITVLPHDIITLCRYVLYGHYAEF